MGAVSAAPTGFAPGSVGRVKTPRFRDGIRAGLPLALAPLLFSASFGLLAVDAGMGRLGAIVMSATTFGGSAQFAAASILEDGGGALAAIVAAILLNARYVPLSLAVASIFPGLAEAPAAGGAADRGRVLGALRAQRPLRVRRARRRRRALLRPLGRRHGGRNDRRRPARSGRDRARCRVPRALPRAPCALPAQPPALATALVAGAITLALLPFAPAGVPIVAASLACLIGLRR